VPLTGLSTVVYLTLLQSKTPPREGVCVSDDAPIPCTRRKNKVALLSAWNSKFPKPCTVGFNTAARNYRPISGLSGGASYNASWFTKIKRTDQIAALSRSCVRIHYRLRSHRTGNWRFGQKQAAIHGPKKTHRKNFTAVTQYSGGIKIGSTELWNIQNPNMLTL
jgi:hypothetical protein